MQLTTKKNILIATFTIILATVTVSAQSTNNLSSSPYSMYGLGIQNTLNAGATNSLANTGIAMPSNGLINGLNPAFLGNMTEKMFLYDIGLKLEQGQLYEDGNKNEQINGNFSNLSIAFPISKKSGLSFSMLPVTNVGYSIWGLENTIDGSTSTYYSYINGTGGLNSIQGNYGYGINNKLRFGIRGTYLFGQIKEEETADILGTTLQISEENFYNGFRLTTGLQYDITNKISFGAVVDFPTTLNGKQTQTAVVDDDTESEKEIDLDGFKLPLEVGLGLHAKLSDKLFVNVDYKKSFWENTSQSDFIGDYVDQSYIGLGAEYTPEIRSPNYWKRVRYRGGFNYDNGNLSIKGNRINNYSVNVGAGFPIGATRRNSLINFSYSYAQRGQVLNGLIKENLHTLTLNFSLQDFWFVKRKID